MSILIRNGRIINAERDIIADILIENEKITAVAASLPQKRTG